MTETEQLLRTYTEQGSEVAFRELVDRYIDLVYSVAFRKVDGDAHLAQDVAQGVFTDLANKARTLPHGVMLGGWLHRHTCFVASMAMRSERRRQSRERQAMEMNALHDDASNSWKEMAPVLDDAINELESQDRNAIMLRYFEQHDLRTVGAKLGVSDDAAQKRVGRALEKLRGLLESKGVALTTVALGALLTNRAVEAAPAGMSASLMSQALNETAKAETAGLLTTKRVMVALMTMLMLSLISIPQMRSFVWRNLMQQKVGVVGSEGLTNDSTAEVSGAASVTATNAVTRGDDISDVTANSKNSKAREAGVMRLTILAAGTGKPVSRGQVESQRWDGEKFNSRKYVTDSNGICLVAYLPKTTSLEVTTRIAGLIDTRLRWNPDRGERIPENYTLRLKKAAWIGGRVVGPEGGAVAGAKVGFNHESDPEADKNTESQAFGWIETKTDQDGRWSIDRIAPEMIRRLYGSASHADYVGTGLIFASKNGVEQELRDGTHVFHLGQAVTVRGVVLDTEGKPVAGANVLAGIVGMSGRKKTKSLDDGTFVINGCQPGKNLLTAEAKGYAATTIEVEFSQDAPPFEIKLQTGKSLLLKVVNKRGEPVAKATAWLNTFNHSLNKKSDIPPVQAEFHRETDSEGRILWENAPDAELVFDIAAGGYMRLNDIKVRPDGAEHMITLTSALVIYGTVQDDSNGQPVTRFRIGAGCPDGGGDNSIAWSSLDRFWQNYNGGEFRHQMEEPVVVGSDEFVFRIEAQGYEPYVTRTMKADEGEVRLDVKLHPAEEKWATVLFPDGTPAAGVDVGLGRKGTRLEIQRGGISRQQAQVMISDAEGHVVVPADPDISRIVAVHSQGFLETTPAALQVKPEIRLQPWGSIEGTYLSGGVAAPGKSVTLSYGTNGGLEVYCDFQIYSAKADAEGHFVLPQVPPGQHGIGNWVRDDFGDGNSSRLVVLTNVTVLPGKTSWVTIGAGYKVNVRVRLPASLNGRKDVQTLLVIHTPVAGPPKNIMNNPEGLAKWQQEHPEFLTAMRNMRNYAMSSNGDGTWTGEGIASGTYTIDGFVGTKDGGTQPNFRAQGKLQVIVPADPASGSLDAGELILSSDDSAGL